MEYTNYLTTPSGRYCEVKDITNAQYLILVKFLQSENYKKFFECLDQIVRESIPNIDDFDVIQRCYVYIAMCMYSIKGTITVNNTMIGQQEIPLATILNNIESSYIKDFVVDYELRPNFNLQFGYPKKFTFQGNSAVIDYYSGLRGFNGVILDDEQKVSLKKKLGTKELSFIDDYMRSKTESICNIFEGVPMNKFQMNIGNESMVMNVISFFNMSQEGMYQVMYAMIKHLKMSYSDFMKISFNETSILLKICAEENKKMAEESKTSGKISGKMLNSLGDE